MCRKHECSFTVPFRMVFRHNSEEQDDSPTNLQFPMILFVIQRITNHQSNNVSLHENGLGGVGQLDLGGEIQCKKIFLEFHDLLLV